MCCALDTNGIVSPINFPVIWLGRPIAVAHFDAKLGEVREARSRAATIKLTYRVGLPKRHDFGLRLCQWVDEGMLLRSPTLAEVSQ